MLAWKRAGSRAAELYCILDMSTTDALNTNSTRSTAAAAAVSASPVVAVPDNSAPSDAGSGNDGADSSGRNCIGTIEMREQALPTSTTAHGQAAANPIAADGTRSINDDANDALPQDARLYCAGQEMSAL